MNYETEIQGKSLAFKILLLWFSPLPLVRGPLVLLFQREDYYPCYGRRPTGYDISHCKASTGPSEQSLIPGMVQVSKGTLRAIGMHL
jgi:hypothetical protein